MSDLVERVARAMIEGEDDSLSPTDKWRARAAIKAVAKWLKQNGSTYEERVAGESLLLELEDTR